MNALNAIASATVRFIDAVISRITGRDTLKELREINASLRLIASCVSRPSAVNAFNHLRTGDKHSY